MAIRVVQLGTPRRQHEGTRLGTVRRPPRGVKKEHYAARNFFDLWFPDLAPSAELLSWARDRPLTDTRWRTFTQRYRREMAQPAPRRLISLLAALSVTSNFSVGCFCQDEARCHRSILRALLQEAGATFA